MNLCLKAIALASSSSVCTLSNRLQYSIRKFSVSIPMATSVPCGSLACQKDSYLKTLSTTVISCNKVETPKEDDAGKKSKKKKVAVTNAEAWHVVLSDTILFPEGGGQPNDVGKIGESFVTNVQNVGGIAVHTTSTPIDVGSEVAVEVDWDRRWDNMQQHSGQHLITATAIKLFGFQTEAWNLGAEISFLDLATSEFTNDQLAQLEKATNQAIFENRSVTPRWIEPTDPEMTTIRCRGLPDDVTGAVRVLEMESIDKNLCCGTHVKSTAHLQAVKLLKVEKAKKQMRVFFLAGDRILTQMGAMFSRQQAITTVLAVRPEQHPETIEKMAKNLREAEKRNKGISQEYAQALATMIQAQFKSGAKVASFHREVGDIDFMKAIHTEVDSLGGRGESTLLLTTVGVAKGSKQGMFMLSGADDVVKQLGPIAAVAMGGKGGGKGRFQGKVTNIDGRDVAIGELEAALTKLVVD
eukprot:m.64749 g.64749  ORF g.64749 m.64749 type:complete len:468 (+) comp23473_c0_seq1:80-1483(+)